ncbi:hypothetical protein [Halorarius litoreus]|uniref:hypothetical protein n=1 Tax=Halorarius litoreus TaxID=2962676 RepID=UPI0020CEAE32|nr:hypothetical protein [Halorarius litoreus]
MTPSPSRRRFLATAGAASTAALAGCTSFARRVSPRYEVTTQPSIGETHITFFDGRSQLANVTVRVGSPAYGPARVETLYSGGVDQLLDYRLRLRPRTPDGTPCNVALRRPEAGFPEFRFGPAPDYDWTEFVVDEFDGGWRGTFGVGFDITPWEPTDRVTLDVDLRATVSDSSVLRPFVVEARTEAESRAV